MGDNESSRQTDAGNTSGSGDITTTALPRTASAGGGDDVPVTMSNMRTLFQEIVSQNQQHTDARFKKLEDQNEQRFKKLEDALASSRNVDIEEKRARGLARFNEDFHEERKKYFIDAGLTADEALQAAQASAGAPMRQPTVVAQPLPKRETFTSSQIGTFDGSTSKLIGFITRIETLWDVRSDAQWRDHLLEALPLCLRGAAQQWYEQLPRTTRVINMRSWPAWRKGLEGVFSPDTSDLRRDAEARTWRIATEDVSAYHFEKLSLLRAAYPHREENDFVKEIHRGLPDEMQLVVRSALSNGKEGSTCEDLLREERHFEATFKRMHASKKSNTGNSSKSSPSSSTKATTPSTTQTASSSSSPETSRTKQSNAPRFNLKETWSEANVFYKDGKRHYHLPGMANAMVLNRNCHCGGEHFNFEHDHLMNRKIGNPKGEPAFFLGDYPVLELDSMDVDDFAITAAPISPSVSSSNSSNQFSAPSSPSTVRSTSTGPDSSVN